MGKLTRRVKYIAPERRLSIPAEFLHQHGIERGDRLVVSCVRDRLYVLDLATFETYERVVEQASAFLPGDGTGLAVLVRAGRALRLGSQDRVVLPRDFAFQAEQSLRLHWEMENGVLVMEAEGREASASPAPSVDGQRSLLELMPTAPTARFDAEAAQGLIEQISTARVDFRDRTWATSDAVPPDALLRSIKVEGVRRPLVLRELGDRYQVVDGFRRLAAARQLRLRTIPAVVWRGVRDEDVQRLKLMESPADGAPGDGSTVGRLQSTLRLHEEQVALKEIEHITGRRRRTLQRYLRVAQEPAIRDAIEDGRLSIFKAEEILKAGVDADRAIRENWTVKQIRDGSRTVSRAPRTHGPRRRDA